MLTILNHTHLDLFLDLKKNNPGQWKMGAVFDEIYSPSEFFENILTHNQAYTVGWVEDNELKSIATLFEDTNSPSWSFLYYANQKMPFWNYSKIKGNVLFSELFQESFRRKLTSCVILTRKDFKTAHSQTSERMKKRLDTSYYQMTPEIKMFDWVDEAIIPANTTPKYQYMQWLITNRTWPIDFVLRRGYLKQEYRTDIIYT
jgi:hypothetical protein